MNKKGRECTWVVSWLLHGKQRLVSKHKIVACMSQSEINQAWQSINQWGNHTCGALPKPDLVLHKLIPWIPLFEIMTFIHAYFKMWKSENY